MLTDVEAEQAVYRACASGPTVQHGKCVSCVAEALNSLLKEQQITAGQRDRIQSWFAEKGCACMPATCAAAGASCGIIEDGCAGPISCGTCEAPASRYLKVQKTENGGPPAHDWTFELYYSPGMFLGDLLETAVATPANGGNAVFNTALDPGLFYMVCEKRPAGSTTDFKTFIYMNGVLVVPGALTTPTQGPPCYSVSTFDMAAGDPSMRFENTLCPVATPNLCSMGPRIEDWTCVDIKSDPVNCGACGNVCPAGAACLGGACFTGNVPG